MQYNTQQKRMPLPEYGRSIQNMVDHALTIEDRAERQRCVMYPILNINYGIIWLSCPTSNWTLITLMKLSAKII